MNAMTQSYPTHFAGYPLSDVEYVEPATLHAYQAAAVWPPAWRGTSAWRELEASISRHRAVWHPLYALQDGAVVDGLARLEIALACGLEKVPVRRVLAPLPLTPAARAAIEEEAATRALARRQLSADQVRQLAATLGELAKARAIRVADARAAAAELARHRDGLPPEAPADDRRAASRLTPLPGSKARPVEARPSPAGRREGPPEPSAVEAQAPDVELQPQHQVAIRLIAQFGAAEDALVQRLTPEHIPTVRAALFDAEREFHELTQRLAARWAAQPAQDTEVPARRSPAALGG
jgi:hypothetical protein